MKNMKTGRIWLAIAILFAAAAAFAQTEADYTFDAAAGTITKYEGWDTEVVIPAAIGGKPVTAIGDNAFESANLTSVTIPNSVTSIGESAFSDNKLTAITIPGSVVTIGKRAFSWNQLTSVVIPEGVRAIGQDAFTRNNLASVSLPSTFREFDSSLYEWASQAPATVILAANINAAAEGTMGMNVYYNYLANDRKAGTYTQDMLREDKTADNFNYYDTQYGAVIHGYEGSDARVRIPAELGGKPVKAITGGPVNAMTGGFASKRIAAVLLPDSLTYIGDRAFPFNILTAITIPAGVTYIGTEAFTRNQLAGVVIPDSVTYIGKGAFSNNKLTNVIIPASVTYMGGDAFTSDSRMSITMPAGVTIGGNTGIGNPDISDFYNGNGKKAGRYTFDSLNYRWSYTAR